jgi:hypothetical protein
MAIIEARAVMVFVIEMLLVMIGCEMVRRRLRLHPVDVDVDVVVGVM